jgi:ribosome-binding factor A
MGYNGIKPPSQRQLKVGEELRHALSDIFMRGDFYDPKTLETITVTISEVSISPDLGNATVYVMPLGGANMDKTMERLEVLAPKIRSMIAKKIQLRRLPELYFKLDDSFIRAHEMNNLFNKDTVKEDLAKPDEETEDEAQE